MVVKRAGSVYQMLKTMSFRLSRACNYFLHWSAVYWGNVMLPVVSITAV